MSLHAAASWHLVLVYLCSYLSILLPRASRCVQAALLILQSCCHYPFCIQPDFSFLNDALNQSIVTQERIDAALRRMLLQRIRLGDFDPPEQLPWANISMVRLVAADQCTVALPAASCWKLKSHLPVLPFDSALGWATLTLQSTLAGPTL